MKSNLLNKEEVGLVIEGLEYMHPDARCELNYSNPFELIIAVVLSAQTTDVAVNLVTPQLFEIYDTPQKLANAEPDDIEKLISKIGLYRNKSKNIIALSKMLIENYGGEVPNNFDELVKLPGVGRKTANVVLAEAFGHERIAVDTHVFRVANRIGLSDAKDVLETEKQLMERLPKGKWTRSHHLIIIHGRRCCNARKPLCENCKINGYCKYFTKNLNNPL